MVSRVDPIWLDIIWIMDFQLYYDEQLGRWVDKNAPDGEGENKPPPPPMIPKSKFQNILNEHRRPCFNWIETNSRSITEA